MPAGCQPIRLDPGDLGRTITQAEEGELLEVAELFGPASQPEVRIWQSQSGVIYTERIEVSDGVGRAVVTLTTPDSAGVERVRAVRTFRVLEDGAVALVSVERPGDELEIRFLPPLVIVPATLVVGETHTDSARSVSTRKSGKDGDEGLATVEATLQMTAQSGDERVGSELLPTLTIELKVKTGPATWARKSVETVVHGSSQSVAGVQEQLRVLGVLIRDERLRLVR